MQESTFPIWALAITFFVLMASVLMVVGMVLPTAISVLGGP